MFAKSQFFFKFCEELLIKFKDSSDVSIISGTNLLVNWNVSSSPYLFSLFGNTWGWASWRRAWAHFDHSMSEFCDFETKQDIKYFVGNIKYYEQLMKDFK